MKVVLIILMTVASSAFAEAASDVSSKFWNPILSVIPSGAGAYLCLGIVLMAMQALAMRYAYLHRKTHKWANEKEFLEAMLSRTHKPAHSNTSEFPLNIKIQSLYLPAETKGGDWYDYTYHPITNRIYLCMGDVSGPGLSSAIVTMTVAGAMTGAQTIIKGAARDLTVEDSLDLLAVSAHKGVRLASPDGDRLMTMVFLCLDLNTRNLFYLNAGHPSVYIKHNEKVKPLLNRGSPLGLKDGQRSVISIPFPLGSQLLCYTDGIFENSGPQGAQIKLREMKKLMESSHPPHQSIPLIQKLTTETWQDHPKNDDTTCLTLYFGDSLDQDEGIEKQGHQA